MIGETILETIFKIIPVPIDDSTHYTWIQPKHGRIMVSWDLQSYNLISDEDFHGCEQYTSIEIVCFNPKQMFSSTHHTCEFDIFTRKYSVNGCATRKTPKTDVWLETDQNSWFFMISNSTTLTSICSDQMLRHEFHGSGIISLQSSCILKGESIQIFGRHEMRGADITLPSLHEIWNDKLAEPIRIIHANTSLIDLNITANLTNQIHTLRNQIHDPIRLNYHDVHHYGITYLSIICSIVVFIWIIRKLQIATVRLVPMPELPPSGENVV